MENTPTTLRAIVGILMTEKKGIFAVDESQSTMQKRLALAGVEHGTEEDGDALREMLFGTEHLDDYISGAILYETSLTRKAKNGAPLAELLRRQGILLGVKVDKGLAPLFPHEELEEGAPIEQVSRGLDTLEKWLPDLYAQGVRFTKWRSVFSVGEMLPTPACIQANAHVLAQYATMVQAAGMVPIIEPEVLYDGEHSFSRSQEVHAQVLHELFAVLQEYHIDLGGMILKTSMVLGGKQSGAAHSAKEVAEGTLAALEASVPEGVGGVVFLSGGQTPQQATDNLHALHRAHNARWPMTFSYSRATEEEAIIAWAGKEENVSQARVALLGRLQKLTAGA